MSSNFDTFKLEGNTLFKEGKYEKAVQSYNKCIELESWNPIGFSNKAMALIKLGSYQEAILTCQAGLSLVSPNDVKHISLKKKLDYRLEMAKSLQETHLYEESRSSLETKQKDKFTPNTEPVDLNIVTVDSLPAAFRSL